MGLIGNYINYLEEDSQQDRAIKTAWRVGIRILQIVLLRVLVSMNLLTFNKSSEIVSVVTLLSSILVLKDLVVDNIPGFSKINAYYNLLIEGLVSISIVGLGLLFNIYSNNYNLFELSPAFIVAVGLNFFVMAVLNLCLALWEKSKSPKGFIKYEDYIFFHNGIIIFQTIGLIIFGLGLYSSLNFSDYLTNFFLGWL